MKISTMIKLHIAMGDKMQKDVAKEIGIGPSALTRLTSGRGIDQHATIRVIDWLFKHDGDEVFLPKEEFKLVQEENNRLLLAGGITNG